MPGCLRHGAPAAPLAARQLPRQQQQQQQQQPRRASQAHPCGALPGGRGRRAGQVARCSPSDMRKLGPDGEEHPDLQQKVAEYAAAAPLDDPSEQVARLVAGNFGICFVALMAFALIAFDVFGTGHGSLGLFPRLIDQPTHEFIHNNVPEFVRKRVFEKVVSNIPTGLALIGWAICSASAISQDPVVNTKRVAIALAVLTFLGGGAVQRGDVILVYELKQFFHRTRPSQLGGSLSFPSGHTASAVFVVGALLFILLPLSVPSAESEEAYVARLPVEAEENLRGIVKAWREIAFKLRGVALPIWAWSTLITAASRIVADVHWVSDTVSGACLGTAVVSFLAFLINRYTGFRHRQDQKQAD